MKGLGIINSFDTWHGMPILFKCLWCLCASMCIYVGTKNVGKEMKKVSQGLKRNRGKTWFPELSDKRKSSLLGYVIGAH